MSETAATGRFVAVGVDEPSALTRRCDAAQERHCRGPIPDPARLIAT